MHSTVDKNGRLGCSVQTDSCHSHWSSFTALKRRLFSSERIIREKYTLLIKKTKFSSYFRKFRKDRVQSYIWLSASPYMNKYFVHFLIFLGSPSSYLTLHLILFWISLFMRNIFFSFFNSTGHICTWTWQTYEISLIWKIKKRQVTFWWSHLITVLPVIYITIPLATVSWNFPLLPCQ